ncbi:hypothetical protein, unlikely [Trypanosoma brucei gambiense DAL972]|uniref:Uncharacterized protein n=1 Tax=Trypanosoma brucei gambiense (strain MHOM/CI/86/DAL972) TaxID=679716 RepID=C9ZT88_TRYB9|nr:hypothetical protein, unlikely [Trypanosoma brucei gambiense DAL972]CBH12623.1 hypothetical protein, unlikely [Trypanosoma brucei gambiense DAL972]|eukprot:XP_011774903.1 hypothetical protein, unlikely [Trypanosoma brucei gambiense DAL972]
MGYACLHMRGIVFNDAYEHFPFHPALSYCFLDVSTSNYRAHLVVAAQVVLTGFGWLQNNVTHRGGRKKKKSPRGDTGAAALFLSFFLPQFSRPPAADAREIFKCVACCSWPLETPSHTHTHTYAP